MTFCFSPRPAISDYGRKWSGKSGFLRLSGEEIFFTNHQLSYRFTECLFKFLATFAGIMHQFSASGYNYSQTNGSETSETNEGVSNTRAKNLYSPAGIRAAGAEPASSPQLCPSLLGDRRFAFRLPRQEYFRNRRPYHPAKGGQSAEPDHASHYRRSNAIECTGSLAGRHQMRP